MAALALPGLGFGYFVQRVLEEPEVDHVVVYELREDVLELCLSAADTCGQSCSSSTQAEWQKHAASSLRP